MAKKTVVNRTEFARIFRMSLAGVRTMIKSGVLRVVREHGRDKIDLAEFKEKYGSRL